MTTDSPQLKESGHWYQRDGTPCYTIIGKNGNERNTTLADARKLDLLPSVTTILKEAAKPGLENWKQEQVLWAALTATRNDDESDADFIARIMADSKEQGIKAAERGKQIHAWIQQGMEGKDLGEYEYRYYSYVWQLLFQETGYQAWTAERSFSTDKYGGKIDLSIVIPEDIDNYYSYILDIKTKDKPLEGKTIEIYDEHKMQLGAYRQAVSPQARCGIVFVSTVDVSAKLVWIPEDELVRGTDMFNCLVDYYYKKTGLHS